MKIKIFTNYTLHLFKMHRHTLALTKFTEAVDLKKQTKQHYHSHLCQASAARKTRTVELGNCSATLCFRYCLQRPFLPLIRQTQQEVHDLR